MKTELVEIHDNWKLVKNACRTTARKNHSENEATEDFKKRLLVSEHSPIRLLEVFWRWEGIKYWLSTEWSRHKFEKFISTQRNDRQAEYDRNAARQDVPVNFDGYANMQNLIDAWRKRLCHQAHPEARALAEDFKRELAKSHPAEAAVLVPNCIYRCGCPEFQTCGVFREFWLWLVKTHPEADVFDIQCRYDLYNEWGW